MDERIANMIRDMQTNPGASEEAIKDLLEYAGTDLPADYLALLRFTDGAAGPIGEHGWFILHEAGEVAELTELSQMSDFGPNLVRIGTDGGSTFYAIRTGSQNCESVEFVQIDPYLDGEDAIEYRAPSLYDLLHHIASAEADDRSEGHAPHVVE